MVGDNHCGLDKPMPIHFLLLFEHPLVACRYHVFTIFAVLPFVHILHFTISQNISKCHTWVRTPTNSGTLNICHAPLDPYDIWCPHPIQASLYKRHLGYPNFYCPNLHTS